MMSTKLEFRSGDVSLVADRHGDPTATPVVLLHGGGQTRHAWGRTAMQLAEAGFCAVAVDLRGHGESGWDSGGDYSLEAMVADLEVIVAMFGRRPVLVGASTGGIVALLAEAESDAGLAAAMVLVDIAPRIDRSGADRIMQFMTSAPDGYASLDEASQAIADYLPTRRRPSDLDGLRKNLRQGGDGRWRWHWDPAFLHGETRRQVLQDDTGRFREAARALTVPTLLVRGAHSDVLTPEGAAEFLELCPHAEFVDVADAAHMVAGDSNEMFTAAVLTFIEGLSWPARTRQYRP